MPKSLVINCSTGASELVDVPEEIKQIEEEPFDEIKEKRNKKRRKAKQFLKTMNGKDIEKMTKAEQTSLLIALCQLMDIADENNFIAVSNKNED